MFIFTSHLPIHVLSGHILRPTLLLRDNFRIVKLRTNQEFRVFLTWALLKTRGSELEWGTRHGASKAQIDVAKDERALGCHPRHCPVDAIAADLEIDSLHVTAIQGRGRCEAAGHSVRRV